MKKATVHPRFKFELGDHVRDRISGFHGVVVARTELYNRCFRYQVQSKHLVDGSPVESRFDEDLLTLVRARAAPPPAEC